MHVKSFIFTLLFAAGLAFTSYAQQPVKAATVLRLGGDAVKGSQKPSFIFEVNQSDFDLATVNQKATYYTSSFTVDAKKKGSSILCTVVLDPAKPKANLILKRYFINLGITQVNYDNTTTSRDTFFSDYVLNNK